MDAITRREGFLVLLQSFMVVLWITGAAEHAYLYDDNLSQWQPITDYGIDQLLHGTAPNWNPYILNGIRVDEVGYYGLANPFMIVAHLIAKTGFSNTISIYIVLVWLIGSWVAYRLAREVGSSRIRSHLLLLCYQLVATYWVYGHWYYIFNNYLMIPLLLFMWQRFWHAEASQRAARAWSLAATFGLAVGLGNIQYAIYQFLFMGIIIAITLVLTRSIWANRGYLIRLGIGAGIIALPTLSLLMSAGRFPLGDSGMAIEHPLGCKAALFDHWNAACGVWIPTTGVCGGLALIACIGGVTCVMGGTGTRDRACWFGALLAVSIAVVFASGTYVDRIPLLNQFRYAFKWWFCIPPLLFYLAAFTPAFSAQSWRWIRFADYPIICLGIALNYAAISHFIPFGKMDNNTNVDPITSRDHVPGMPPPNHPDHRQPTRPPEIPAGWQELASQLDLANYRYVPCWTGRYFDTIVWQAYHSSQRFVNRHLTANIAVRLGVFTPIGYHVGLRESVLNAVKVGPRNEAVYLGVCSALVWPTVEIDLRLLTNGQPLSTEKKLACECGTGRDWQRLSSADAQSLLADCECDVHETLYGVRTTIRLRADGRVENGHPTLIRFWQVWDGKLWLIGGGWNDIPAWFEQLALIGVRYLIIPTEQFDDALLYLTRPEIWQASQTRIERIIRTNEYAAIELGGIPAMITGPDEKPLSFRTQGDGIIIPIEHMPSGIVMARFNPEPGFRAYLVDREGKATRTDLAPNGCGGMGVLVPPGDWVTLQIRIVDQRIWLALSMNLLAIGVIVWRR